MFEDLMQHQDEADKLGIGDSLIQMRARSVYAEGECVMCDISIHQAICAICSFRVVCMVSADLHSHRLRPPKNASKELSDCICERIEVLKLFWELTYLKCQRAEDLAQLQGGTPLGEFGCCLPWLGCNH